LYISTMQVHAGFDVADNEIVKNLQAGDLVITADIPLASMVVEKGCMALNPRGQLYSESNIKLRLSLRDFSEGLRNTGVQMGGPDKLSKKEIQSFSNCLDQFLTAHKNS
jgi:uncharacterized protein